ncbi:MAG: hypothetical protein LBT97_03190 [Planctomycetota bacterium]|nr:hypothetical protein [Planctomycetota bacterium]
MDDIENLIIDDVENLISTDVAAAMQAPYWRVRRAVHRMPVCAALIDIDKPVRDVCLGVRRFIEEEARNGRRETKG